jgi:hypothetical protein
VDYESGSMRIVDQAGRLAKLPRTDSGNDQSLSAPIPPADVEISRRPCRVVVTAMDAPSAIGSLTFETAHCCCWDLPARSVEASSWRSTSTIYPKTMTDSCS